MASPIELATASGALYEDGIVLSAWATVAKFVDRPSGYASALFKKGNEHIFGFRGTDENRRDWVNDNSNIIGGIEPEQYAFAARDLTRCINEFHVSAARLYVTGHSLGGALAALTSYMNGTPLPVVTFNSPGVRRVAQSMQRHKMSVYSNFRKIMHIRTEFDRVSQGTGERIAGQMTTIEDPGATGLNATRAHRQTRLIELMKNTPAMHRDLGWI